jgi:pyruvate,orthophosphate dikinase
MKKWVYLFGKGITEGSAKMRDLLGGKGANLAEMTLLGVPVPPGFTISTEACRYYYQTGGQYPPELKEQVEEGIRKIEELTGKKFGDPSNPLLFSVRSGAPISMPGMMDTVLNLGLNDETVEGLASQTNDPRFAYDCYRRFIAMYGDVVLGLKPQEKEERDPFEVILEQLKEEKKVKYDSELDVEALKELVVLYKKEINRRLGIEFPQDPYEQLWGAIAAVFRSWDNPRAIAYRRLNNIPDDLGTAVNVQSMVFGNMGWDSGTGVVFTRNPATGENYIYGEYLLNAQGEDVVAGIRTPQPINKRQKSSPDEISLEEAMPDVYQELERYCKLLERHFRDMQDVEFTIERRKLYILQTRSGKRTGFAALRIAVDMVEEGLIDEDEALLRVDPEQLNQLLRPIFDPEEKKKAEREGRIVARGLPAGPGAASGRVVFFPTDAEEWAARGEEVLLVRIETSPEDIRGMSVAQGILTARGGMTSHAALVARQMGKVCVVGCEALKIDYVKRQIEVNGKIIKEGDYLSIDGSTGEVIIGRLKTQPSDVLRALTEGEEKIESETFKIYKKLMQWADKRRRLKVMVNADRPDQARLALAFGAEGIGLCRTEHMFFEGERIYAMREMIIAEDSESRKKALAKLLPMQKEDFKALFRVMNGLPVTIRTLDPPLHEFLPHGEREIEEVAQKLGISPEELKAKVESLKEANPMLGHRGCRLGITYPEITRMQAQAIFEAACEVKLEGVEVYPEVMIPLVGHVKELRDQKRIIEEVAEEVFSRYGVRVPYKVGTMIEIARAAVTADEIAQEAEFFSFGTNDLTQTTYGISRDDIGKFLKVYIEKGIWDFDPFVRLDTKGVGQLMEIAVKKGRGVRPDLKLGICGEHGGEPSSVEFCHRIGLDYVSCSPLRIPIAKLAAAQAVVKESRKVEVD